MISAYENKMMPPPENKSGEWRIITDGALGGCGEGPIGDPNTYHPKTWQFLIDQYEIRSVLDIGCGFGYSTRWFGEFKSGNCFAIGIEGSEKIVKEAVWGDIITHDFREGKPHINFQYNFDLCWCCEVLEHIPQQCEENVFSAISRCQYAAITAASPGQGGHNHINEQTPEYWIERFEQHGFTYMGETTKLLRSIEPDKFFAKNGLFFSRTAIVESKPHWTDVEGWLPYEQGEFLQRVTAGKKVLELGTYHGRSTFAMAQVAKQVTTIDHHRGDDGQGNTLPIFQRNLDRFGLNGKIEPIVADLRAYEEEITKRRFDVVFVDSMHDAESVERDTIIALECLQPGGWIVWHDFNYESVKVGIAATGIPLDKVKDLGAMGLLMTEPYQVMAVMPHTGNVHLSASKSFMRGGLGRCAIQRWSMDLACGCLPQNFNVLLATALMNRDQGILTHMAMLHSDVSAEDGWIDILAEEMCLHRSSAISAIVAIKDPDDDRTSTAIGSKQDPWLTKRYIRLRDEVRLPVTFGEDDVCNESGDDVLLINTACMLLDLSHEFWDNFCFQVHTRKLREWDEANHRWQYECNFRPEDWEMSRELDRANLPYHATWRVKTFHHGNSSWENRLNPKVYTSG